MENYIQLILHRCLLVTSITILSSTKNLTTKVGWGVSSYFEAPTAVTVGATAAGARGGGQLGAYIGSAGGPVGSVVGGLIGAGLGAL